MSWEILVQDLPEVVRLADVPKDFRPGNIGARTELIARIRRAFPAAEEQDGWLFMNTEAADLSIQFHNEDSTKVRYMMIHVHGGNRPKEVVGSIVKELGLRAVDTDTGELFNE